MKKFLVISLLSSLTAGAFAEEASAGKDVAKCEFVYNNKTDHAVTLQGYFMDAKDDSGAKDADNWIVVKPNSKVTQIRVGSTCEKTLKRSNGQSSGQIASKVDLKNDSGFWLANKGLMPWMDDKSFSRYTGASRATADDGVEVTLSDETVVTKKQFNVSICNSDVGDSDCR